MKLKYLIIFFSFLGATVFAQDNSSIPSKAIPKSEGNMPKNPSGTTQYSISKPFELTKFKSAPKNTAPIEFNKPMDFNSKVSDLKPGAVYEKKLNEAMDREYPGFSARDQYFGEIRTKSKFVKLVYYDYATPDGDNIRIWMNDMVVMPTAYLSNAHHEIFLDLLLVSNKIEFEALNEGESSPNTARFDVYDDKDVLIYTNMWGLSTGFRASFIITKERE